eukprot:5302612-Lingulodinium_polyedra.AAC.1
MRGLYVLVRAGAGPAFVNIASLVPGDGVRSLPRLSRSTGGCALGGGRPLPAGGGKGGNLPETGRQCA